MGGRRLLLFNLIDRLRGYLMFLTSVGSMGIFVLCVTTHNVHHIREYGGHLVEMV
jgi:hypothetical protein